MLFRYDFLIVLIIWLATGLEAVDDWLNGVDLLPFSLVLVLRPLRLVRILKAFDLYREIVSTLRVLAPRMLSALVVICVVYYSFGVIGNEVFADVELTNCCKYVSFIFLTFRIFYFGRSFSIFTSELLNSFSL